MNIRRASKQLSLGPQEASLHSKQVDSKEGACPVMPGTDRCISGHYTVKWLLVISGVPFQVLTVKPLVVFEPGTTLCI